MADEWMRPELRHQEQELETKAMYAQRTGIGLPSVRSRFTRYADQAPEAVMERNGRAQYYLPEELDAFFSATDIANRAPRTPYEVALSELHRLRVAMKESEERKSKREADLRTAEAALAEQQVSVQKRQEQARKAVRDYNMTLTKLEAAQAKVNLLGASRSVQQDA